MDAALATAVPEALCVSYRDPDSYRDPGPHRNPGSDRDPDPHVLGNSDVGAVCSSHRSADIILPPVLGH